MEDKFFQIIDRFMLPMEKIHRVIDSTYFLRKDLGLAFAQGYCHPPGRFYGRLINYPDPSGALEIFGRRYSSTNKHLVNGALELLPIDEQLSIHRRVIPGLVQGRERAPFGEYHALFDLDDCRGFFEHNHSLRVAMEVYPWLSPRVKEIAAFIGMPVDRLGTTGSLAYGKIEPEHEHEDLDLTIHGSVEELQAIFGKIRGWLKDPKNRVIEFGKLWPMRFFLNDLLVCPFFIYGRPEEIPLVECEMETIREELDFSAVVSDDRHGIFLPIFLRLEKVRLAGGEAGDLPIIIYDSYVRGEFTRGCPLEGRGRLVRVKKSGGEFDALLVTNAHTLKTPAKR